MLLSIGMIVKNEEKRLDSCLSSLLPILDRVDSELIIADTGSSDRTVEIAKKYTENVFYFEWIKDFSAARNSTLDKARGEWFMFIDADETLISCDEIIEFFVSGEYKKFKSATYIQRNYTDSSMQDYADFRAPRMVKREAETRFVNAVHEKLIPFDAPQKHLDNTIADHYGYMFSDEKLKLDKFKRNTEILLNRLAAEEQPELAIYLQLYQSFVLNDEDKALDYLNIGIDKAVKSRDIILYPLYDEKAAYYYNRQDWSSTAAVCDEYFRIKAEHRTPLLGTDADIIAFRAVSFLMIGDKTKAAKDFAQFFGVYREIREGRLETPEMAMCCYYLAVEQNYFPLLDRYLRIMSEQSKISALDFLTAEEVGEYFSDAENGAERLIREIKCETEKLPEIYAALDNNGRESFKQVGRYFARTADDGLFKLLIRLSQDDSQHIGRLNVIRKHFLGEQGAAESAELLAEKDAGFEELLYIMAAEKLDLTPLLTAGGFNAQRAAVYCFSAFSDMCEIIEDYPLDNISNSRALVRFSEVIEQLIYCGLSKGMDIDGLFSAWGRAGKLAAEKGAEQTGGAFAAAAAGRICDARARGDIKACVSEMSAMLKAYNKSKPIVMAIRDKLERKDTSPLTEMQKLAAQIKENIIRFIENGETEQAAQLLSEYEKLCPNDGDIAVIKQRIFRT